LLFFLFNTTGYGTRTRTNTGINHAKDAGSGAKMIHLNYIFRPYGTGTYLKMLVKIGIFS
jgi:hypothetical protein